MAHHLCSVLRTTRSSLHYPTEEDWAQTGLVTVVDCRNVVAHGMEVNVRRVSGFLLQMFDGLEALQGLCWGDGEEAALHIVPVAQKGNSETSCLGVEGQQVADTVMTAQGGVALPRDGAFDASDFPSGWGNNQPIRPVQGKAK